MNTSLVARTDVVPFLDLLTAHAEVRDELDEAMARVVDRAWFIQGPEVAAFEQDFAGYVGAQHAVGVANGLDALTLGLRALGVGVGDEVVVPAFTFVATWMAVSQIGAVPVPADIDLATYALAPEAFADAITERTRAVIPVHLYGRPAPLAEIGGIARRHGIFVVADAAQAHGARLDGNPVGAFADVSAWSFYPGKNLGALGDGGALTTSDPAVADRVRVFANYGSRVKYDHEALGVNSRLDEIQAAALSVKLARLEGWNARRSVLARRYHEGLAGTGLVLPPADDATQQSSWHLYVVRTRIRDRLQADLASLGIQTLVHYPTACHLQPAYAHQSHERGAFPNSEQAAAEVLSLPFGPHVTEDQADRVVEAVAALA